MHLEGDLLQGFLSKLMIVHQYLVTHLVYAELESDETGLILIQIRILKSTRLLTRKSIQM
ncbi:TPA: hypothetical protein U1V37_000208 [Streptococcus suis]|nr:hypothetical protein [Streptococcus suis]